MKVGKVGVAMSLKCKQLGNNFHTYHSHYRYHSKMMMRDAAGVLNVGGTAEVIGILGVTGIPGILEILGITGVEEGVEILEIENIETVGITGTAKVSIGIITEIMIGIGKTETIIGRGIEIETSPKKVGGIEETGWIGIKKEEGGRNDGDR